MESTLQNHWTQLVLSFVQDWATTNKYCINLNSFAYLVIRVWQVTNIKQKYKDPACNKLQNYTTTLFVSSAAVLSPQLAQCTSCTQSSHYRGGLLGCFWSSRAYCFPQPIHICSAKCTWLKILDFSSNYIDGRSLRIFLMLSCPRLHLLYIYISASWHNVHLLAIFAPGSI